MEIEVVYIGHKETKKGDRYLIVEEVQMKHPETREWVDAYIYYREGSPEKRYCREVTDFWKHFRIEDPVWDVSIESGEGWQPLLDDIKFYISQYNAKNKGYGESIKILQAKEKFGELRVYVNFHTPELSDLIDVAVRRASKTCELCGSTESVGIKSGGWITTMCEQCVATIAAKQQKPQYWHSEGKRYVVHEDGTKTIKEDNDVKKS